MVDYDARQLLRGRGKEVFAGLLAAAASFRAKFTVVVFGGVFFTLPGARGANRLAGAHLGLNGRPVGVREARQNPGRGSANVGAIEIRADAGDEFFNHLLVETGIGADGADVSAFHGGREAEALGAGRVGGFGMRLQHLRGGLRVHKAWEAE